MISLILPYYERWQATLNALRLMANIYPPEQLADIEIIVVNDGSIKENFRIHDSFALLNIWIVRLQSKERPKNPCVPYNRGVLASCGDYIALSNPETLHTAPVLLQMRDAIKHDNDYVMAAAWCPEQKRWHCHSSMNRANDNDVGKYLPAGANYHFMSMMTRSMWNKIGGFDEDYRQGAGYDDPDLVRRLHKAGANFIMRDDLVVDHVRTGARANWTAPMFARNRAVFVSKWAPLEKAAA